MSDLVGRIRQRTRARRLSRTVKVLVGAGVLAVLGGLLWVLLASPWLAVRTIEVDGVTGELTGNFEMFFLSGVTMVTAGTFIIVYNADLLLPPIARMGSRFGRFYPAVRMAVAYPLVSRFRTGMTIAMIGLISFALIMFSTVNANFDQIFLGDESTGGWDIYVPINSNNPIDDLQAELTEAGVMNAKVNTYDDFMKDEHVAAVGSLQRWVCPNWQRTHAMPPTRHAMLTEKNSGPSSSPCMPAAFTSSR